jgi:nicotinate-nucleotide adenylyltransferase
MPLNDTRLQVLYGGTFDPVHEGHLAVARHARDVLRADVALMPARDPPHKGPTRASAAQRAQMLGLTVAGEPGLRVDLRELERDGPSYTVDTLRQLREQVGAAAPWAILVGEDSFRALDSWSRWRELFGLAHIVVASRAGTGDAYPGQSAPSVAETLAGAVAEAAASRWVTDPAALAAAPAGRILALQQPLFPQSASELRRRIAAGEPWRGWVAPAVAAYIDAHGLYS